MARRKTTVDDVIDTPPVQETQTDTAQIAEVERQALILRQFGDGLPFDPYRYEIIIRDHLSRSAEAMLAAGRALIVARESLPHGDWMPFVDRVGLEVRVAQRMMQAAFKFSDDKTLKLIEAAGNKTKLFELLVLDDEQIQELADGGTVAGLELDDIAEMSSSELRAALRESRAEQQATEKLLADKNSKIDGLKTHLEKVNRRLKDATVDEMAEQAAQDVAAATLGAQSAITVTLGDAVRRLAELHPDSGTLIAGHIAQVRAALDELVANEGIQTLAPATPSWVEED